MYIQYTSIKLFFYSIQTVNIENELKEKAKQLEWTIKTIGKSIVRRSNEVWLTVRQRTNPPPPQNHRQTPKEKQDRVTDGRQTEGQTGRRTDRPTDRQTDRHTDRQTGKQTDWLIDRHIGRHTDRQTVGQTERNTGRQTDWLADSRQIDRHTGRHIDGQID